MGEGNRVSLGVVRPKTRGGFSGGPQAAGWVAAGGGDPTVHLRRLGEGGEEVRSPNAPLQVDPKDGERAPSGRSSAAIAAPRASPAPARPAPRMEQMPLAVRLGHEKVVVPGRPAPGGPALRPPRGFWSFRRRVRVPSRGPRAASLGLPLRRGRRASRGPKEERRGLVQSQTQTHKRRGGGGGSGSGQEGLAPQRFSPSVPPSGRPLLRRADGSHHPRRRSSPVRAVARSLLFSL